MKKRASLEVDEKMLWNGETVHVIGDESCAIIDRASLAGAGDVIVLKDDGIELLEHQKLKSDNSPPSTVTLVSSSIKCSHLIWCDPFQN